MVLRLVEVCRCQVRGIRIHSTGVPDMRVVVKAARVISISTGIMVLYRWTP
jgi:hypothetical protein